MALIWTDRLSTGVEEIDNQHKSLFDRINSLQAAMKEQRGKDEVLKVFDFLGDYVETHFATEQGHMKRYDYPDYAAHKELHEEFKKGFKELKEKLEKEGSGFYMVIKTSKFITGWWIDHILSVDVVLGKFLKTKL